MNAWNSQYPIHNEWTSGRAYERATESSGCLLFFLIPILILLGGCFGCLAVSGENQVISLTITSISLIIGNFYLFFKIMAEKRWAILGFLILAGVQITLLFGVFIRLMLMIDTPQEYLAIILAFLIVLLIIGSLFFSLVKAYRYTWRSPPQHGFEVILKPKEPPANDPQP